MNKSVITNDEYTALAEEIQSCFTERVHAAREEILMAHHETGKVMAEFLEDHPEIKPVTLRKRLEELGAGTDTTLYLSHECYKRWPNYNTMIDEVGQGKNTSWNKVRKLLAAPKEEKIEEKCKNCSLHCNET